MADLLDIPAAAATLDVSERTIRREIAAGRLAVVKIRGRIKLHPAELSRYITDNTTCRSAAEAPASKSACSLPVVGLRELLRIDGMRRSSRPAIASESQIIALAERRASGSKKPSNAG